MSISAISLRSDNYQIYSNQRTNGVRQQSDQDQREFANTLQSVSEVKQPVTIPERVGNGTIHTSEAAKTAEPSLVETNATGVPSNINAKRQDTPATQADALYRATTGRSAESMPVTQPAEANTTGIVLKPETNSVGTSAVHAVGTTAELAKEGGATGKKETPTALSELKDTLESMGYLMILNTAALFISSLQQFLSNGFSSQNQMAQQYAGQYTSGTDFSELGQAIEAGDLSKAKEAYTALQNSMLATSYSPRYNYFPNLNSFGIESATNTISNRSDESTIDIST